MAVSGSAPKANNYYPLRNDYYGSSARFFPINREKPREVFHVKQLARGDSGRNQRRRIPADNATGRSGWRDGFT